MLMGVSTILPYMSCTFIRYKSCNICPWEYSVASPGKFSTAQYDMKSTEFAFISTKEMKITFVEEKENGCCSSFDFKR